MAQLVVGPHSSASLIRTTSSFTVDEITLNQINTLDSINIGITTSSYKLDVSGGDINTDGVYRIDGTEVLSNSTLGVGVTNSNLENVGNLLDLTVIGDVIVDTDTLYVDTTNDRVGINNSTPTVDLDIIGDVLISGDLNVLGGITSTTTIELQVTAPLFRLAITNAADIIDTGVYAQYVEGGTTKFNGYFRDATDNTFKFFTGLEVEPTTTIDTGATGYTSGNILVNDIEASSVNISTTTYTNDLYITGNLTVDTNTLVVDSTVNMIGVNTTPSYELDISGNINTTNLYKIGGVDVLSTGTLESSVISSSLTSVGTLTSLDVSGDLSVNTNTLFVQSSSGRVGIGRVDPAYKLDVTGGSINTTETYKINGLDVLSSGTLESNVTSSSLTSVGTLTSLDVNGNIIANSYIGIGTTNPTEPLHIEESSISDQQLVIKNPNSSGKAGIQLNNSLNDLFIFQDNDIAIFQNDGGDFQYFAKDTGDFTFHTTNSDTPRFHIENDGNIGVGYKTPTYLLDITGGDFNTNSGVYRVNGNEVLNQTTIGSTVVTSSLTTVGTLQNLTVGNDLNVDSGTLFVDSSEDYVGINQLTPQYALDVSGTINFTGLILMDGAPLVNSDGLWTQQGIGAYLTLGGNVGIGTTNPDEYLHINDSTTNSDVLMVIRATSFEDTQNLLDNMQSEIKAEVYFE